MMQTLSYETVQNFCRACLKELEQSQKFKISSLNLQIRHWLEDITLDYPLSHDIYSNFICQSCRNKLKEFLEFHLMCKQSRKTVDTLTQTNGKNRLREYPNNGISYVDCSEIDDTVSFDYFTKIEEPGSIVIYEDEPLICRSILNVIQSKHNKNDIHPRELAKPNCSDDVFAENEDSNGDSESDIHIKNITSLKKKEISEDTKKNSKLPNSKGRKKYTYSFPCDQCKYRSVSQQLLDVHMRTHYGLKPYQCPKCDGSFNKATVLLKHLNDAHSQKELITICEHEKCGKQFSSSRSYKDHYRQNHLPQQSNKKLDKSTTKSPSRHVCEECGKVYTKLQTFKEHKYTHGSKEFYPFQCDVCSKAFVKQRTYDEHKLRHAGIKNFECVHCGAKRTTKKELREHMNSHTRERQYPCPNCPMIFYRTSNRRVHIDVVHQGIRRFVCRYCDQTFGKGDNLKNHELLHTGEKPHACTECGKSFVQRVSLRLHMKIHK